MKPLGRIAFAAAAAVLVVTPGRLARASDPPHDSLNLTQTCRDCHIAHQAPGSQLTNDAANANLCMSCHQTKTNPTVVNWQTADQATPGASGSSHRWDAAASSLDKGAQAPTNATLLAGLAGGTTLQCSTCHNQHSQANAPFDPAAPATAGTSGRHFLTIANNAVQMCVDCHAPWNQAGAGAGSYYTLNTATFTNGSPTVTGQLTVWSGTVQPGWRIKPLSAPASAWSVVKTVTNLTITLTAPYTGTSATAVPYVAAKTLSHPVGVALTAGDFTFAPPIDASGTTQVAGFNGTATGGGTTSLQDSTKNFTGAVGLKVRFTSGAYRNTVATITSLTGTTQINFAALSAPGISAGTTYEIDADGNLSNNIHLLNGSAASSTTGNVVCMSCHGVHFADASSTTYDDRPPTPAGAGNGTLLRRSATETCSACHPATLMHNSTNLGTKHGTWGTSFTCLSCHEPHQTGNVNLVRPTLATPNNGNRDVDLRAIGGGVENYGLANAVTPGTGPCETCHTNTRNGSELTGATSTFTAGGTSVTLSSTTGLAANWEIKRTADGPLAWTKIATVVNGTSVTLAVGYKGTTGGATWQAANPRFRNTGSGRGAAGTEHYVSACLACHPHKDAFKGAGEPANGGQACDGCHTDLTARMSPASGGTTLGGKAIVSRHQVTLFSPSDSGGPTWASPLNGVAATSRSCVNMCHGDHPHDITNPATHEYNAYLDATSAASRADGTGGTAQTRTAATRAKTDFDAAQTNGGMCLSCHRFPVDASVPVQHPAIDKTAYTGSAHNYVSNTVGASTYNWTYTEHDSSTFNRNCTKCHAERADGRPNDGSIPFEAVHYSSNPSLLSGNVNPAAAGNINYEYVCYNCHGNGAASTGTNLSGKDLWTPVATRTSGHKVNTDQTHDSITEYNAASAEGQASGPARHVNCLDCHDAHEAGAARDSGTSTATSTTSLTDSSKNGKWIANQWTGYKVIITPTTTAGTGQSVSITGNTAAGVLNVASWPSGTPPAASGYTITKQGLNDVSGATKGVWGLSVTTQGTVHSVGSATFASGSATAYSGASGGVVTTASNLTTVTAGSMNWVANQWSTYTFRAITGLSAGQTRTISANAQTTLTVSLAITLAAGDLFVIYKSGSADTPVWAAGMVGGYIRNELDRDGRWYRITAVNTANAPSYSLTITPTYNSATGGLSDTKITSNTTAPTAQWQMDAGTLYSINYGQVVAKTAAATKEYEICLRCHSSYAFGDSPPNVPSAHVDGGAVAETNVPLDFASGQLSYHPIFAPGLNQPTTVAYAGWAQNAAFTRIDNTGSSSTFGLSNTFTTGWFKESLLQCSDCHASDTASDPIGPHGSGKKWILKGLDPNVCWTRRTSAGTAWETICNSAVPSTTATEAANYCLNCHRWDVYGYIGLRGDAPAFVLSRVRHDVTGNNNTYGGSSLPRSGVVCQQCHGGDRIGGPHGSSRRKYPFRYDPSTASSSGGSIATTISAAPGSFSGKRLLNGAYWFGVTRATTSAGVACWGKAGVDTVSTCGHGHENTAGNPAQYSYDDAAD